MDALQADDRESNRALAPGEKLARALEMMSFGIQLERASFRHRFPHLTDQEIEKLLADWLTSDG